MNICHLISGDLWAGAEVQVFTLVNALKKLNNIHIFVIVLNDGKLYKKLKESEVKVYLVDESKISFSKLIDKIGQILKDNRIEILHTHRYKENILGGLLKNKCKIKGLISTIHGMPENISPLKNAKMYLYIIINYIVIRSRFFKCIAVSDNIKQKLKYRIGYKRLCTINNAIDVDTIKNKIGNKGLKKELDYRKNQIIIGSVGRLMPVKGFDDFLRVAKILSHKVTGINFVIVGDGPQMENLKLLAQDLNVSSNVVFAGFKDNVIDYVNIFDLFLVTSHYEGIPMAVLEAMALGKTVVSSNVGGMSEIIKNNHSGFLTTPGNIQEMADKCFELINNRELYAKFSDNSLSQVKKKFSIKTMTSAVVDLYKSALTSV